MSRASLEKKPREVASMFDGIARRYDLTNNVISLGQDRRWRRATVEAIAAFPGEKVLDLAAGTGASSEPLIADGVLVVPCDFSTGMLEVGKQRHPAFNFTAGDAMRLPFAEMSFDAVTISFGLRNVTDTVAGLREMLRVVRPGGRIVISEFSDPTWAPFRKVYSEYLMRALPKMAGLVTKDTGSYDYLAESIRSWPDQLELAGLLQEAGWEHVGYRNLSGGIVALHRATRPR